jgi:hypothetical protein
MQALVGRVGALVAVTASLLAGATAAHAQDLGSLQLPVTTSTGLGAPAAPADLGATDLRRAIERAAAAGVRPRKLRRQRPGWFTPSVERRLARDRDGTMAAPADAPLPGEVGIRPGSWMIAPFWCTMNFIFRKGDTLAIGTAGHCLEGNEPVVLLTVAPTGGNPVLVELGRVLLKRDAGIGRDYGLVEIPPERHDWVFPTMGVVGGPCGVFGGGDPQPVAHYGHGVGVGTGGTPRAGMGFELEDDPGLVKGVDWDWDADSIVWAGLINGGDSGSGVRIGQLPAVSNLTHGIGITGLEPSAIAWGTRVTTITSRGWTLVNSPLCPP